MKEKGRPDFNGRKLSIKQLNAVCKTWGISVDVVHVDGRPCAVIG